MKIDSLLHWLKEETVPPKGTEDRIRARIQSRIGTPALFADLHTELTPKTALQQNIWNRIGRSLIVPSAGTLQEVRKQLTPSRGLHAHIRSQVLSRLHVQTTFGVRVFQWAAAFALFALVVRASPLLFIASPTIAESEVLFVPTRGDVFVSIAGLWQPVTDELQLEPGMLLRTKDGEASILFRDNGVVRLDNNTTIEVLDTSNRLEPAPDVLPTLSLVTGRIWLQGLIPTRLRGITVATSYGHVTVNEGSVSIAENEAIDVEIYDRRATVLREANTLPITAGERVSISDDSPLLVKKIADSAFQLPWAVQNLQRDAVHRHEIAQLQHERRIAQAGILPTSRFYSVKRIAEKVDVLFTFGEEARMQKQIQQAETRLNEAAALIADGDTDDANLTLDEYRGALTAIMSGSGDTSLARFLVQQSVAEATADMAAALPGDESYIIKKTVLVASTELPNTSVSNEDAQSDLLIDGLTAMTRKVYAVDTSDVEPIWNELAPYVTALESGSTLRPDVYKEARTLLTFFAESLTDANAQGGAVNPALLEEISTFLPSEEEPVVATLSEEELAGIVLHIKSNIFLYNMAQPRINQLTLELKALEGHPDQGRILRRLIEILPDGPEHMPDRIYKEIVRLRWEKAAL